MSLQDNRVPADQNDQVEINLSGRENNPIEMKEMDPY